MSEWVDVDKKEWIQIDSIVLRKKDIHFIRISIGGMEIRLNDGKIYKVFPNFNYEFLQEKLDIFCKCLNDEQ